MKSNGNSCENDDWSAILTVGGFPIETVRDCHFAGTNILRYRKLFFGAPSQSLMYKPEGGEIEIPIRCGIRNVSTVSNCVISAGCAIENVGILSEVKVSSGSIIMGASQILGCVPKGQGKYGVGSTVKLGCEMHRVAKLCASYCFEDYVNIIEANRWQSNDKYADQFQKSVTLPYTIIEGDCKIFGSCSVINAFIGKGTVIHCSEVNSAVLSRKVTVKNSTVVNSILGSGCRC